MTSVNRKRRHFRDDFKRQILSDIESGKLNIHNVKDENGKVIKALLVERWKDQFRTEGLGMAYEPPMQIRSIPQPKLQTTTVSFNTDDLLKEIGRLEIENRQLKMLAYNKAQAKQSVSSSKESSQSSQAQSL